MLNQNEFFVFFMPMVFVKSMKYDNCVCKFKKIMTTKDHWHFQYVINEKQIETQT